MKTYKCKVCGEIFTVADGEEAVCPRCHQSGDKLEVLGNKYAGTQTEKNLLAAFDRRSRRFGFDLRPHETPRRPQNA